MLYLVGKKKKALIIAWVNLSDYLASKKIDEKQ